jgi:uncharacterized protein involved in high-affinity Fe2+ transport
LNRAWAGPVITGLIVIGVAVILVANFQPGRAPSAPVVDKVEPAPLSPTGPNAREYPIGEPVAKNHIQVAAVWLAGVSMEGMASAADVIHLEADVKATEGNPNGFAKDEFVPYLKVHYTLADASTGAEVEKGAMTPMVASDGLHYGASLAMPKAGHYKLSYRIDPPSAGGLGRHVGLGGVAPWWSPFTAEFDWIVEPPAPPALAGKR